MKMKFWDRIILRIGAVLTFLGGVLTAVCGAMIYGMNLGEGIVMQSIPLTLICAGVVMTLVSYGIAAIIPSLSTDALTNAN